MSENENNNLTETPEEVLGGPAVVEKINLSEIKQEKNAIEQEAKQAENEKFAQVFDNFVESFKKLSKEDAEELIVQMTLKKYGKKEK